MGSSSDSDLESGLMYLASGDFGYTLVGAKPVSIEQSLSLYLIKNHDKRNEVFSFLERTFRKSTKFIFKLLDRHGYIELINKKAFLRLVRKHKRLSDFVKKKYKSEAVFLNVLQNSDVTIFEAVDHDVVLISLVLGYGEENGDFFVRKMEVGEYLQKYPVVTFFPFDQRPRPDWAFPRHSVDLALPEPVPKPTEYKRFVSLEEEWKHIKQSEWPLCDDTIPKPPYYISLPVYVRQYSCESRKLHETYVKARNKLAKLLCNRKISEVIIEEALKN